MWRLAIALILILSLTLSACRGPAGEPGPPGPPGPPGSPAPAGASLRPESFTYSLGWMPHPKLKVPIPILLAKPPVFYGAGFKPGELVSIELVVGDIELVGVKPGEDVGIAFAKANKYGAFKAKVEAIPIFQTIFRGDMKLYFEKGLAAVLPTLKNPIPPGIYTVKAIGAESGLVASCAIEFLPPKKK